MSSLATNDDDTTRQELYSKISIAHHLTPHFVPEYDKIETMSDDELSELYRKIVVRIHQDGYMKQRQFLERIFSELDQLGPQANLIAGLMLRPIQETIKGHYSTLIKLKEPNSTEQECIAICKEIMSLGKDNPANFIPLFKRYLLVLAQPNEEITIPLMFENPADIIKSSGGADETCIVT